MLKLTTLVAPSLPHVAGGSTSLAAARIFAPHIHIAETTSQDPDNHDRINSFVIKMPRKNINYIRRGFWKQHPGHWAENKGFTSLNPQQQAEAFKKWCLQHPNAQGIEPIKGVEYYDPVTGRSGKAGRQAFHDRQRAAQWARMQAAQSSNIRESTASGQASAQESSDQGKPNSILSSYSS